MNAFLETGIEFLKGVGPQRAAALKKEFGIHSFYDLLHFYPFRYIDRTKFTPIAEVHSDQYFVQLKGHIVKTGIVGEGRAKRFVARLKDETGMIDLVWFQGIRWVQHKFIPQVEYIVYGKPSEFKGVFNIAHPEIDTVKDENQALLPTLQAVYHSSDAMKGLGLDSKGVLKIQYQLLSQIPGNLPEILPDWLLKHLELMGGEEAFRQIHFPTSAEALKKALFRLKFEELFFLQVRILKLKVDRYAITPGFVFAKVGDYFNDLYKKYLPFDLTNAQKRVIREIRQDVSIGKQMNRLIQGDVGSGKTMVAIMSMLLALDNGYQACLMAPTEILAAQHFETIHPLLANMGIKSALLTGNTKIKERREIHAALLSGDLQLLIGTHALIEPDVHFSNLGLVVIDEQHRFGVEQRAALQKKNNPAPHVLVMTATPIPRTLAMTLYGDLETSVIDELPPGRKPIKTLHFMEPQRLRMIGFLREQIKLGRQVYVVFPLIKESEKVDLKNLEEGFYQLEREFPLPEYQMSMVHGKMKAADKDFEMQRFVKGEAHIMVATTVIEVGVNVPNASVMVIENAERFGLSQLHQLRGRVGRGADQSYCLLMTGFKLNQESKTRMDTMVRTNDGFEIAEVDLELRGPGDIEGTQQSGIMNLKLANLAKDQHILHLARNAAQDLLKADEQLVQARHAGIKNYMAFQQSRKMNWSKIA